MLVQLTSPDPIWSLFTVIGILTLFGKKKKDEKDHEENGESSTSMPTSAPNSPAAPLQAPPVPASALAPPSSPPPTSPPMNANISYQPPRNWQGAPQGDEDSSLSRLLQSLLKDLPSDANSISGDQPRAFTTEGLSEWVPPRATPTSRPMVIVPGGKKGPEPDKPALSPSPPATTVTPPSASPVRSLKPPEPVEQTPKEAFQPKFYPPPSSDKPEKPARDEAAKRPSPPKVSQSFDHIFELTQGNLDAACL